jgi:hypothetical protein
MEDYTMTNKGKGKQKKMVRKPSKKKLEEKNKKTKVNNEAFAVQHGGWQAPDHESAHIGKVVKE